MTKNGMIAMRELMTEGEYGSLTTGQDWKMLMYDGKSFLMNRPFLILFARFQGGKKTLIKSYSVLIVCILPKGMEG